MSLTLIQNYSSAEEEEEEEQEELHYHNSSDDHDDGSAAAGNYNSSVFHFSKPSPASGLPSAFDVFSEVSGPPQFLNNCVEEKDSSAIDVTYQRGRRRNRKEKQDLPTGAVVEAKPQLVGIHERVRSDIEGNQPSKLVSSTTQGVKRVATATNPNAEDAAELLRMCLQCGIPKTFSNARGMVCPVCGDRPPVDKSKEELKNKGSTIKDKEKSKRMKGQSSHASWKSETEMQLRQQFD
ncbi:hypothetical protein LWI28_021754 [Acer negundo]|uniref:Uncharacterized protein n=1 Tax=Acer negundo TaxID=4023 RepID=A0AAD5IVL3_ACENE|nr:hypothetical protein LWI28_021754 [Acer negundo]KAK4847122.1 hypothetical protein QYF36_025816 [Acer negundo]